MDRSYGSQQYLNLTRSGQQAHPYAAGAAAEVGRLFPVCWLYVHPYTLSHGGCHLRWSMDGAWTTLQGSWAAGEHSWPSN
jgi:hypothetical protein